MPRYGRQPTVRGNRVIKMLLTRSRPLPAEPAAPITPVALDREGDVILDASARHPPLVGGKTRAAYRRSLRVQIRERIARMTDFPLAVGREP